MTIKQQGGVFGRNPTFNDVTVEGEINGTTIPTNANLARTDASQTFSAMQTFSGSLPAVFTRPNAGNLSVYWSTTGLDWVVSAHSDGYWRVQLDGVGDALRIDGATRDVSVSAGNLVMANGKGIDFSATAGTGTSELFNDYEEGTWTPSWTNLTVGDGTSTGRYTKIGRTVFIELDLTLGSTSTVGTTPEADLPFASAAGFSSYGVGNMLDQGSASHHLGYVIPPSASRIVPQRYSISGTNALQAGLAASVPFTWATGDKIRLVGAYTAA